MEIALKRSTIGWLLAAALIATFTSADYIKEHFIDKTPVRVTTYTGNITHKFTESTKSSVYHYFLLDSTKTEVLVGRYTYNTQKIGDHITLGHDETNPELDRFHLTVFILLMLQATALIWILIESIV